MSLPYSKITWLAGLLEGEGWFGLHSKKYPRISLRMSDLDIVQRARDIMDSSINIRTEEPESEKHSDTYGFVICGQKAVEWMMTLYVLMGNRRKERIKEILQVWKSLGTLARTQKSANTKRINKAVEIIMMSRKVSYEEAELILGESLAPKNQTIN